MRLATFTHDSSTRIGVVERDLVTPRGLRSLSPGDPAYRGTYDGPPVERDTASGK